MPRVEPLRWTTLLSAVAGLCVGLPRAHAQTASDGPGRGLERFAAQRIDQASVAGSVRAEGDVATVWNEAVAGRAVQRVTLDLAVRVDVGGSVFEADRASIWIRSLDQAGTRQVFMFLEGVGSRQAPAGSSARELTVSAVVSGGVTLAGDVVRRRAEVPRSDDRWLAFVERGDAALIEFFEPSPAPVQRATRAFSNSGRPLPTWPEPPAAIVQEPAPEQPPEVGAADNEGEVIAEAPRRPRARPTPARTPQGGIVRDADARQPGERRAVAEPTPGVAPQSREDAPPAAEGDRRAAAQPRVEPAPTQGVDAMTPFEGDPIGAAFERTETGEAPDRPMRPADGRPGGRAAGPIWPPVPTQSQPVPGARLRDAQSARGQVLPETTADLGSIIVPGDGGVARTGVLTFSAEDIAIIGSQGDASERTILLSGGVGLDLSRNRGTQGLTMTAQRAVVFLTPGTLADLGRVAQEDVIGVYLEGEAVLADDRSTQRGSTLYYDAQADRALVLDGVLSTTEPTSGTPLYIRADSVRREGARQWVAERATVANTSFAKPHFAVGAREVVLEKYQREVGTDIVTANRVDARGLTVRAGPAPFIWWPRWVGDPERIPLRGISVDSSDSEGVAVKTTWDAWVLAGLEPPSGLDTELLLDVYEKRGLGIGTIMNWNRPSLDGQVFAYLLPNDNGVDDLRTGEEFDQDGVLRGAVIAENRWDIDRHWTLRLEGTHISDQRFLESVFDDDFRDRRELTTRGVLTRRGEQSLFEIEMASNLDDFLNNEYLLLSRGYSVDRLPEIRFTQLTSDPLAEFAPGLISYNTEVRAGQIGLNFDDVRASERGFENSFQSRRLLGTDVEESVGDRLREEGYNEKPIWRFDTRHELSMPLNFGPDDAVNVTPFVVGRWTSYDSSFSGFSPDEDDHNRLWGAAGVRLATTFSRTDDGIESRTLDLHRLRHVIQPGITLWHADTTIDQEDLPVYDEEVESLVEGSMIRVGLDQKWQTQRGGIGRWRSVDVLTLRAEWVWSSDDVDEQGPIGRYFEERPEFSNPGEFYNIEALWQASEAVGLVGRVVHDIDQRETSYISGGIGIDHGREFRTTFDARRIEAIDATVLGATASYAITPKYNVAMGVEYDTVEKDLERIDASVQRDFPNVVLRASIRHNNVRDETSFGLSIAPRGVRGGFGFSGLGGDDGGRSVTR